MDELKGCPWCYCQLRVSCERGEYDGWRWYSVVGNHNSGCPLVNAKNPPEFRTRKEAVDNWNKRVN